MSGDELTAFLADIILTRYGIAPQRVHAFIRDGAAVNGKATRNLRPVCNRAVDAICSSHTACLSGGQLSKDSLPQARDFVSKWSQMMSTSNIAKMQWKLLIGRSAKTKSMVRWGAEYDVVRDVLVNFGSVEDLLNRGDIQFAENLRAEMRLLLAGGPLNADGITPRDNLRLQLALYHDIGIHIFNFVYDYEGDAFLSPFVYG